MPIRIAPEAAAIRDAYEMMRRRARVMRNIWRIGAGPRSECLAMRMPTRSPQCARWSIARVEAGKRSRRPPRRHIGRRSGRCRSRIRFPSSAPIRSEGRWRAPAGKVTAIAVDPDDLGAAVHRDLGRRRVDEHQRRNELHADFRCAADPRHRRDHARLDHQSADHLRRYRRGKQHRRFILRAGAVHIDGPGKYLGAEYRGRRFHRSFVFANCD